MEEIEAEQESGYGHDDRTLDDGEEEYREIAILPEPCRESLQRHDTIQYTTVAGLFAGWVDMKRTTLIR